eukprot:comp21672_c0_seq1/m.48090 comp21672_c0_seq1/g.48090  ORF comp21672_c0_seq1/g.48090 comp21672_c0_seq1/m.48090 type:complete len:349 (-) comp21672_c0_seq1:719-1765(-)
MFSSWSENSFPDPSSLRVSSSMRHWNTHWSCPPVVTTYLSSIEKRVHVTWAAWPSNFLYTWRGVSSAGYLNSLTKPKSSEVVSSVPALLRQAALMSRNSEYAGQMPATGSPIVHVYVFHCTSPIASFLVTWVPFDANQNLWSPAALSVCRNLLSTDQSMLVIDAAWPLQIAYRLYTSACCVRGVAGSATLYRSTKLSADPTASVRPSGEYARQLIISLRWRKMATSAGALWFQSALYTATAPFLNPTANSLASGLNATHRATLPVSNFLSSRRPLMSQRRTEWSSLAVMYRMSFGCIASPHTSPRAWPCIRRLILPVESSISKMCESWVPTSTLPRSESTERMISGLP